MSKPLNIHDYDRHDVGMDLSDTVIHVCPCGNNIFRIYATFDDYEIATYSTDMECLECGTRAKAPTPIDRPED
jgi:ferredoxin-like protein FixX